MDDLTPRIDRIESMSSNYAINGDMRLSQRGVYTTASSAVSGEYYVDRHKTELVTVTMNKQHISTNQPVDLNNSKSLKMIATNTVSGRGGFQQRFEEHTNFSGRRVTFAAWVKSNSVNARIGTYDGAFHLSEPHSGNGTWELLKITYNVPIGNTYMLLKLWLTDADGNNVAITTGDYLEVTGMQFNFGEYVAFQQRMLSVERSLAQAFCVVGSDAFIGPSSTYTITPTFPVTMRVPPTVTRTGNYLTGANAGTTIGSTNESGFSMTNVSSTSVGGYWTAEAEL